MGSYEPPEHWAPPESLDPTPVWKQYALVALLALGFLALVGGYAYLAVLPDVVTPPAALPGRVVLAASEHPPGTTKKVALAGPDKTFFLSHLGDDYYAVREVWSPTVGGVERCTIGLVADDPLLDAVDPTVSVFIDACLRAVFDSQGRARYGTAPRGLDRYLVSRKGDRIVVNTDHLIQGKP